VKPIGHLPLEPRYFLFANSEDLDPKSLALLLDIHLRPKESPYSLREHSLPQKYFL